jgi:bis(5'-nucleosyl)-tetraphosphatase (symmetrical)
MVTYVIGDIQGCDATLGRLLERLPFDAARDALWFTGDLVNRGPRSLAALRRVAELSALLGERCVAVLGNHDLHLLARAAGLVRSRRGDTLDEVLAAPDREPLLDWLRRRPLLHVAKGHGSHGKPATVLVHAGLHPRWDVTLAAQLAGEAQAALGGPGGERALAAVTRGKPDQWSADLAGDARLAATVAFATRTRTCRADGRLCLDFKGSPSEAPDGCTPWYQLPERASRDAHVVFGHWAALGLHRGDGVLGLDTGCVWGGPLSAVRLEDGELFQQPNVEAA